MVHDGQEVFLLSGKTATSAAADDEGAAKDDDGTENRGEEEESADDADAADGSAAASSGDDGAGAPRAASTRPPPEASRSDVADAPSAGAGAESHCVDVARVLRAIRGLEEGNSSLCQKIRDREAAWLELETQSGSLPGNVA